MECSFSTLKPGRISAADGQCCQSPAYRPFQYPQTGSYLCRTNDGTPQYQPLPDFQYPQTGSYLCRLRRGEGTEIHPQLSVPSNRVVSLPPCSKPATTPPSQPFTTLKPALIPAAA